MKAPGRKTEGWRFSTLKSNGSAALVLHFIAVALRIALPGLLGRAATI